MMDGWNGRGQWKRLGTKKNGKERIGTDRNKVEWKVTVTRQKLTKHCNQFSIIHLQKYKIKWLVFVLSLSLYHLLYEHKLKLFNKYLKP